MIINPASLKYLPSAVERDIRPVAGAFGATGAIIAKADSKYQRLSDLIADAKARPGAISMAWYAASYRVTLLELERNAQVKLNLIPYKTPTQVTTDVLSGVVDGTAMDATVAFQLARSGKVRVLAVTGAERHPAGPEVPTMIESGVPFTMYQLTGYGVHAKTPDDVAKKIEATLMGIVASAEFKAFIEQAGSQVLPLSGAQISDALAKDRLRYRQIFKAIKN
jgi:tripartite-type tricarboxylate transporter receptor subunit TctC